MEVEVELAARQLGDALVQQQDAPDRRLGLLLAGDPLREPLLAADPRQVLQQVALVGGGSLDDRHEVRDEVGAHGELDLDLPLGLPHLVPESDEAVVGQEGPLEGEHPEPDEAG